MKRNTPQKEAVRKYLMSVDTHPSAETVYNEVRKNIPSISKGTVYRILKSFVEEGRALEVVTDKFHFDGETEEHFHFVCRKCGMVSDIFDKKTKIVYNTINDFGNIDSYQLNFYGTCKKCKKDKK